MHYLGALQDMYGGQEDRNRMVQQRQAYADELKLQMQEKQRAKQREALKLKALEQEEWELELPRGPPARPRRPRRPALGCSPRAQCGWGP